MPSPAHPPWHSRLKHVTKFSGLGQLAFLLGVILIGVLAGMQYWSHRMMDRLMAKTLNPTVGGTYPDHSMVMITMHDLHNYEAAIQRGWTTALVILLPLLLLLTAQFLASVSDRHRQFTNQVSHDLRTPLSTVYGYLQSLLRRSPNLTLEQREALEIASAETQRTIEVLQTLLDEIRAQSSPSLRIK
jgi:signal transduction histidine kinase